MGIAERYDGFLVDLDGTVWVGSEVVAGAPDAVRRLREAGKEVVFVTNDSRTSSEELAERLAAAGIPATADRCPDRGGGHRRAGRRVGAGGRRLRDRAAALHREVAAAGLRVLDGDAGRGRPWLSSRSIPTSLMRSCARPARRCGRVQSSSPPTASRACRCPTASGPGPERSLPPWSTPPAPPRRSAASRSHTYSSGRRTMLGQARRVAVVGDGIASDIAGARGRARHGAGAQW